MFELKRREIASPDYLRIEQTCLCRAYILDQCKNVCEEHTTMMQGTE